MTTLDRLSPGQRATITSLAAQGAERRRLMDLGFIPGVEIEVEMGNPLGDPRAFRLLGGVVALRREQAREIGIQVQPEETPTHVA